MTRTLEGKVAVVAGATRGAGRGIATALGSRSGRSTSSSTTSGAATTWRDAAVKVPEFMASETPLFVGRCIAALAADPDLAAKNGRVFASWDLAEEYGVDDADGTRPHFVRWLRANQPDVVARWKKADDGFYAYWGAMPYGTDH